MTCNILLDIRIICQWALLAAVQTQDLILFFIEINSLFLSTGALKITYSVSGYSISSTELCPRYYIFSHFIRFFFFFFFWNVTFFIAQSAPMGYIHLLPFPDNSHPSESAVYRKISIKVKRATTALASIFVCIFCTMILSISSQK